MIDYRQLEALAGVMELGTFEKAAERLCITQSAVSQRVKQLEDRLGQMLLVRANPPYPTAAGQRLLGHFKQVHFLETELMAGLSGEDQPHLMKIPLAINADSLASWFFSALAPIAAREKLLLDLHIEDQEHALGLLREGKVMGCVSSQRKALQGGEAEYLGTMPYITAASPAFVTRYFPGGANSKMLRQAPAVIFNRNDELQHRYLKRFFGIGPGEYPYHTIPSAESFVDIALQNLAYILVPRILVESHLERGDLLEIAPGKQLDIHLYWHHWRLQSRLTHAISDSLILEARKLLPQTPPDDSKVRTQP